jgi:DNA-binding LacI/PurR family transcriptional regulator
MSLTISDVAKAAGVSTATVSNVLNKRAKVGSSTRTLVLSTVKRLGYVPNPHARRLASNDTRTLGIIVSNVDNPFFSEVIKGFLVRTRELGYETILSETNFQPGRVQEAARRMIAHNVSGVAIMTCEISPRLVKELAERKIAVSFLDHAPARGYVSTIRIDYEGGIDQIVQHLYDRGHRRIAFVAGRPDLKSSVLRLEGYMKAMRARGLEPAPVLSGDLGFDRGVAAGLAVAKHSPRPTAVMAVNDLTAVGLLKGLQTAGLRVPEDISVTGFGCTRLSEYCHPSLTTVDVHRDLLGQMAADVVHDLRRSSDPVGRVHQIAAKLVVGNSTGSVHSA